MVVVFVSIYQHLYGHLQDPSELKKLLKQNQRNRAFKAYLEPARQQRHQHGSKVVNPGQSACFQKRLQKMRTLPH